MVKGLWCFSSCPVPAPASMSERLPQPEVVLLRLIVLEELSSLTLSAKFWATSQERQWNLPHWMLFLKDLLQSLQPVFPGHQSIMSVIFPGLDVC